MKKLIFLLTFYLSCFAGAFEGFRCIPSLRQTRLQVLVTGNNIELRIINPAGYEFMPQFDPGSQFTLAFNKIQAQDLAELGDGFAFIWPRSRCRLDAAGFVVNCDGEALNKVGTIKSFGISTTEITEKHRDEPFEKRKFRLNVEKDNLYFTSLEFYNQNCEKF